MIQGDLRQKLKGQSNRERTECRIEVRLAAHRHEADAVNRVTVFGCIFARIGLQNRTASCVH
jgi:hypothetical protein